MGGDALRRTGSWVLQVVDPAFQPQMVGWQSRLVTSAADHYFPLRVLSEERSARQ
jgi:hypothetical protein